MSGASGACLAVLESGHGTVVKDGSAVRGATSHAEGPGRARAEARPMGHAPMRTVEEVAHSQGSRPGTSSAPHRPGTSGVGNVRAAATDARRALDGTFAVDRIGECPTWLPAAEEPRQPRPHAVEQWDPPIAVDSTLERAGAAALAETEERSAERNEEGIVAATGSRRPRGVEQARPVALDVASVHGSRPPTLAERTGRRAAGVPGPERRRASGPGQTRLTPPTSGTRHAGALVARLVEITERSAERDDPGELARTARRRATGLSQVWPAAMYGGSERAGDWVAERVEAAESGEPGRLAETEWRRRPGLAEVGLAPTECGATDVGERSAGLGKPREAIAERNEGRAPSEAKPERARDVRQARRPRAATRPGTRPAAAQDASAPEGTELDPGAAGGHRSVLYEEVLEYLAPHGEGFRAIDCTVDGGGHSFGLLERSAPDGQLLGLDADPVALALAGERLAQFGSRVRLVNRNFRELRAVASEAQLQSVDAIVFDLGLSSLQLASSGRGFSFRGDEPLDMRFDPDPASGGLTAAELLNELPEVELERIIRGYGEEPRARRLARAIVERRQVQPFARTGDLLAVVSSALGPARGRIHPATRVFQALRIAVNDELGALEEGLDAAVDLLQPGSPAGGDQLPLAGRPDREVALSRVGRDARRARPGTHPDAQADRGVGCRDRRQPPGAQRQAARRRTHR